MECVLIKSNSVEAELVFWYSQPVAHRPIQQESSKREQHYVVFSWKFEELQLPSSPSTQIQLLLGLIFSWYSHPSTNPATTYPMGKWYKTNNTLIQDFKYLNWRHQLLQVKTKNVRNGGIWQSWISKSLAVCPAPCVLRQCRVVFAWKCHLFCLCAHVQCRVCYIYHVEFHFRFRRLLSFAV